MRRLKAWSVALLRFAGTLVFPEHIRYEITGTAFAPPACGFESIPKFHEIAEAYAPLPYYTEEIKTWSWRAFVVLNLDGSLNQNPSPVVGPHRLVSTSLSRWRIADALGWRIDIACC